MIVKTISVHHIAQLKPRVVPFWTHRQRLNHLILTNKNFQQQKIHQKCEKFYWVKINYNQTISKYSND